MLTENEKLRFINAKKQLFDRYYSSLNEMQRKAIYTVNGPLLVLAGAGSGKTTVLVKRIAHIIKFGNAVYTDDTPQNISSEEVVALEGYAALGLDSDTLEALLVGFAYENVPPYTILSFTFTNKAAGEMKNRLEATLGEDAKNVWAGTFHSICVRILRKYIERLGYKSDFTIYDTDDCKKLVTECVNKLELDSDKYTPRYVLNSISHAKNSLMASDGYFSNDNDISDIYNLYQKRLFDANAVDFDDIINHCVTLLKDHDDIREYYSGRFKYVFVDEYQDTNRAQYMLMNLISSKYRNVMVVGDDDQSIYKFRGATIKNILGFDAEYKDANVILLEQNYRSTENILSAANAVIKNNEGRKGKVLWTEQGKGEEITVEQLRNQEAEAIYVVDKIQDLIIRKKYSFKDIAVLYRTNAQSMTLETTFSKSGIPHRLLSGTRFFDRKEIKDIVAYLSLINNNSDNIRLTRIINVPKRGIGKTTVDQLVSISNDSGKSIFEIMKNPPPELSAKKDKFKLFCDFIDKYSQMKYDCAVSELINQIIQKSGYMKMLEDSLEDEQEKIDNINELISSAMKYQDSTETSSLSGFLEEVALVSDLDNYDTTANAVVLMTIHSAKGLEFPIVFLVGMEENLFPSSLSSSKEDDLEEERRLAYVAITRAKNKLYMTCARERLLYGRTNYNMPSRFITEIPDEYTQTNTLEIKNTRGSVAQNYTPREKQSDFFKSQVKSELIEVFRTGDCVVHRVFGKGTVKSAVATGGDTLYEIEFDLVGAKKLLGNYAKLKKGEM